MAEALCCTPPLSEPCMWRCGDPVRSSLILPFRTSVCDVILGVVPALEASFKMTLATFAETLPLGNRVEGRLAGETSEEASQTASAVWARAGHRGPDVAEWRCTAMRIGERRRPAHQSGHAAGSVETTAGGWPTLGIIRVG
ncbi:hypothetical protein BN1708_010031, partial [Verticillium longisporum]